MWRTTIGECVEQEAKLITRLFIADAQNTEYRRLHFRPVNTDRTTARLGAVEHHVVSARQGRAGIGFELFNIVHCRGSERVMQGRPAITFFVPLEHRKINHP